MKTMTSLEKQINELAEYEAAELADNFLKKLGICVCLENNDSIDSNQYFPCYSYYKLYDKQGKAVWYNADMFFDKFETGNELLEAVFLHITSFVFFVDGRWMVIQNPFLGCRSLEEAMIRMDLAGEDGDA